MAALDGAAARALRAVGMAAVSRMAPGAALRALDGIADRGPPPRTYASQSQPSAHTSGQPQPPQQ
ncbi:MULTISPECIES: hypothetical protein [unclassified Streptomyces]|uniref:hypothetical protein n=1 Tax=unclassified Streptomyces TaxID=2593676 RepID=UPI002DDB2CD3|nr:MULTISPECIES: hypothetical protein [unclassified Streptomyces]WSB81141.1 hypothetical protein OHB04_39270 [Streptomyces sp. NBC_01775]WSS10650.1 hypothetical protein OG533_01010 [Streptomyces sp. NBC_01186]WSS39344.1 hypothetical protein OG220_01015 [Streptomyces sp. NBC_01187]